MLAIAFVPSLVFLLTGVALAGYLVHEAVQGRSFATRVHESAQPAGLLFANLREERRLTLQALTDTRSLKVELEAQRARTDTAAQDMAGILEGIAGDAPADVRKHIDVAAQRSAQLDSFRQEVDSDHASLQEAYDFYNGIMDAYTVGLNAVAQQMPTADTAYKRMVAMPLFVSADGMSRGDALAAAGLAGGELTEQEFRTYIEQIGAYHSTLEQAVPDMIPSVQRNYEELISGDAWATLTSVENAFLRGNTTELPVPEYEWRAAAEEVGTALWNLYVEQSTVATELAEEEATSTLITSILAGVAVIAVAVGVFLVAWRMSNRLVGRLVSLRAATLEVADERMPRIVERLRTGEQVDLATEVSYLDHGDDEIGQVAEAFNKAQRTAIAAAVEEAETREGTRRVFLNIAHRSQVIVHRQLAALEAAERKQEDPDQLDLLFRLDHLSTRARRNAENLIILGGEQPGRQFRNPVPVIDIVRGAIAETEDYKRVNVDRLPAGAVVGPVVGDLVHLLAELIDNATTFSPPQSRVEVRGELVGRGVVIEVEDQGIGMEAEARDRLNEMLRKPPDFSFMALSEEPRLGLFVVARLAAKHGFTVTLRESAYGGTRAIVLVRTDQLSDLPEADASIDAGAGASPTKDQPVPVVTREPKSLPQRTSGNANGAEKGAGGRERNGQTVVLRKPNVVRARDEREIERTRGELLSGELPSLPEVASADPAENGSALASSSELDGEHAKSQDRDPTTSRRRTDVTGRHAQPLGGDVSELPGVPEVSEAPTQYVPKLPREATKRSHLAHEVGPRHEARPTLARPQLPSATQEAGWPSGRQGGLEEGKPPLPRRRRQQNLAPQLMTDSTAGDVLDDGARRRGNEANMAPTPEQARSRLSAFQQGTRKARQHPTSRDDSGD